MSQGVSSFSVWPAALPVRAGKVWFKWRSISPLPLLIGLLFIKPNFSLGLNGLLLVSLGILFSEAIRLWAVGFAGSATRTRGHTVPELVHAGPYRLVRNPLYIANMMMYTLCGVLFGHLAFSGVIFIYSLIQYSLIVSYEESLLEQSFGLKYVKYREQVPRWIPSLSSPCRTSSHLFSLQRALRSERSTFIAMASIALLLIVKRGFGF